MRKVILLILSTICLSSLVKAQDVRLPDSSFATFNNDTTAYLAHNWGTRTSGVYQGRTIGEFFSNFELPISSIEISINSVGEVSMVRFYTRNRSELRADSDEFDKYSILAWLVFDSARRPKLEQVAHHFSVLERDKSVAYTWCEEYRELMKDWVLEDVQYNYGIFTSEY